MRSFRLVIVVTALFVSARNAAAQPAPPSPDEPTDGVRPPDAAPAALQSQSPSPALPPARPLGEVTVTPAPAPGSEPPPIELPALSASASRTTTSETTTSEDDADDQSAEAAQTGEAGDTSAPAGVAGYFPGEGFAIKSLDDEFKLRVGLQAAYRFEPYWRDGDSQNRRTFFVLRPFLEGHVFRKWIRYWTSFEFAGNPPYLLDSFVEIQPEPEIGLRIGQQWSPISRHEYYGPQQILFPEWAIVADYFWPGRDKGVTVMGTFLGETTPIEYWAGVYSGTPLRQFTAIDGNYVLIGRVTASPLGPAAANEALYITSKDPVPFRVSFTVQGYLAKLQSATENFNPSSFRFDVEPSGETKRQNAGSVDVWLQGERFTFLAEGYLRNTDPEGAANSRNEVGVWGQAGVMLIDRTVDAGVRLSFIDPSSKVDDDRFFAVEGQLGYYPFHNQNLVVKLRYAYGHQDTPPEADAGRVSLPAPTGDNQLVTLQLGLAF